MMNKASANRDKFAGVLLSPQKNNFPINTEKRVQNGRTKIRK